MNCTRCNMPLEPNARFCRNCGAPVATVATNNASANPAPPYRTMDTHEPPTLPPGPLRIPQAQQPPPQQTWQPQSAPQPQPPPQQTWQPQSAPQPTYYQPGRPEPSKSEPGSLSNATPSSQGMPHKEPDYPCRIADTYSRRLVLRSATLLEQYGTERNGWSINQCSQQHTSCNITAACWTCPITRTGLQ